MTTDNAAVVKSARDIHIGSAKKRTQPNDEISLTVFKGQSDSRLTKSFELENDGTIKKISQPFFSEGIAIKRQIASLNELPKLIDGLSSNECISTGAFDLDECKITTNKLLTEEKIKTGFRSRSLEHMKQPSTGLLLIDHDHCPHMPEHLKCSDADKLMATLAKAIPELKKVAFVGRNSSSAGVYNLATKEERPSFGMHVYIGFRGDIKAFQEYCKIQLWNAGFGYIGLSRNGALLERTIIDLAVLSPERLIYEAAPVLGEGVGRHENSWVVGGGQTFEFSQSPTENEIRAYKELVRQAKEAPETLSRSDELHTAYRSEKIDQHAASKNISLEQAAKAYPTLDIAARNKETMHLTPDFMLEVNGSMITVEELVAQGEALNEISMPDPIEGAEYGTTTAKFYFNDGRGSLIFSFAHGLSKKYFLSNHEEFTKVTTTTVTIPDKPLVKSTPHHQPLDVATFPDLQQANGKTSILQTIPNIDHMLRSYGISIRYCVINNKIRISIPGQTGCPDNAENTALTSIISLAKLNRIGVDQLQAYLVNIADKNPVNPVADWVFSKPWDGKDRLNELYDTIVLRDGFPIDFRNILVRRWLLSAIAAALKPSGFRSRGVLTLQGPQSIGKTTWLMSLVPNEILRDTSVLIDHLLDVGNKDSVMLATTHWLVELGELESSFKRDQAKLKGFITSNRDKVRAPYARTYSEHPRRTVFFATVNDSQFLVDQTGNTRFWTIPVKAINYDHKVDMQQLWAQVAHLYEHDKEQWWLSPEEETMLESHNKNHRIVSVIREEIGSSFDFNATEESWEKLPASGVLKKLGYKNPTNPQSRECGAVLRDLFGEPKKSQGVMRWNVPPLIDDFGLLP